MQKIKQVLDKIGENTLKENSRISSNTKPDQVEQLKAKAAVCPICGGVGYLRQDLPIDHPDFGRMLVCSCRQKILDETENRERFHISNLDAFRSMTFDTFNPHGLPNLGEAQVRSLDLAYKMAKQYAEKMDGWMLLMGGFGCGKTHLAAAIANHAVTLGVPTLMLTVPDLMDWLRSTFGSLEESFTSRFDEIREIQLLVLDDLGTQNSTAWAQEKLYQIINYRYTNRLQTVITTNLDLREIDGRISSRIQDTNLVSRVKINAPDYRRSSEDTSHPILSTLQLHAGRTFGNFSLREREKLTQTEMNSLEKAFRAAHQFAEDPQGWLVLMGDFGCGKTHLAAAVGNYRHSLGESPLFVVVPDLLDHLRATFGPGSLVSYDDLFEQVRSVRLLILDDLGTQTVSPWAREKLYQIFNHRYVAELPTIITTASKIEELDPRIRTRMMDKRVCNIFLIDAPPYRAAHTHQANKPQKARRQTGNT